MSAPRPGSRPEALLDRSSRFIDEGVYEGPAANNPTDDGPEIHEARADIYRLRRDEELSLMSKGIFGSVAWSQARVSPDG